MNLFENLAESGPMIRGAVSRGNLRVLKSMLGPAYRGLIRQKAKGEDSTEMALGVVFSLVVGCGLMALVFYSSRSGYDATPRYDLGDEGPTA